MQDALNMFLTDEGGAVTVDWVVLTASIVGLGLLVISQIAGPTTNVGTRISDAVVSVQVGLD
jgi:hypothetical protein